MKEIVLMTHNSSSILSLGCTLIEFPVSVFTIYSRLSDF